MRGLKRYKVDDVAMVMDRLETEIMGLSEVKWSGKGKVGNGKTVRYSGSDASPEANGVSNMIAAVGRNGHYVYCTIELQHAVAIKHKASKLECNPSYTHQLQTNHSLR